MEDNVLRASKEIVVRFSEVDMMQVAWHGSYPLYLEDAREAFGSKYGLTYQGYLDNKFFAPIVDMQIKYKQPLRHGRKARVDIVYRPTEAAKIVFDYEIYDVETGMLCSTARTIQVFMDMDYRLVLTNPPFFEEWKKKWQQ